MSNTNATAPAATVPQILARLILLQHNNELPDPNDLRVRLDRMQIDVTVPKAKDVTAWAEALGRKGDVTTAKILASGAVYSWLDLPYWHGWKLEVEAREEPTPKSELDTDTVTGLAAVLAGRVPDDRVGEILAGLNSFVVYELEPHTEIIDGVSVLKREIVGADFNLDKAVDWALDLPEVSCTGGPDRGTADVELVDGTVLEFIPSEKSWSVTVSDDAEAVSA